MNKITNKTVTFNSIGKVFMKKIFKIKSIIYIIFSLYFCYFALVQGGARAQGATLIQANTNNVCTNLKTTIRNKLNGANQLDWQMTLTDVNGNILGYGSFNNNTIDIDVYNDQHREFYLYFFTNNGPINFTNGITGFRVNYFVSNSERKIVITHRLQGRTPLHLNDCIISMRELFTGYALNIH